MAVEWKHTTMRLPQELVTRIDAIAASMDRSRAWVFVKALEAYLKANEPEQKEEN